MKATGTPRLRSPCVSELDIARGCGASSSGGPGILTEWKGGGGHAALKAGRLSSRARQAAAHATGCFWNCSGLGGKTNLVSARAELRHNRPQLLGEGSPPLELAQILRGPMRPLRLGVAHRDTAMYQVP